MCETTDKIRLETNSGQRAPLCPRFNLNLLGIWQIPFFFAMPGARSLVVAWCACSTVAALRAGAPLGAPVRTAGPAARSTPALSLALPAPAAARVARLLVWRLRAAAAKAAARAGRHRRRRRRGRRG